MLRICSRIRALSTRRMKEDSYGELTQQTVIGLCLATKSVDLWRNLCTSLMYFVVRVRCGRKESSRSLSHLLMSFLYIYISNMLMFVANILSCLGHVMGNNGSEKLQLQGKRQETIGVARGCSWCTCTPQGGGKNFFQA